MVLLQPYYLSLTITLTLPHHLTTDELEELEDLTFDHFLSRQTPDSNPNPTQTQTSNSSIPVRIPKHTEWPISLKTMTSQHLVHPGGNQLNRMNPRTRGGVSNMNGKVASAVRERDTPSDVGRNKGKRDVSSRTEREGSTPSENRGKNETRDGTRRDDSEQKQNSVYSYSIDPPSSETSTTKPSVMRLRGGGEYELDHDINRFKEKIDPVNLPLPPSRPSTITMSVGKPSISGSVGKPSVSGSMGRPSISESMGKPSVSGSVIEPTTKTPKDVPTILEGLPARVIHEESKRPSKSSPSVAETKVPSTGKAPSLLESTHRTPRTLSPANIPLPPSQASTIPTASRVGSVIGHVDKSGGTQSKSPSVARTEKGIPDQLKSVAAPPSHISKSSTKAGSVTLVDPPLGEGDMTLLDFAGGKKSTSSTILPKSIVPAKGLEGTVKDATSSRPPSVVNDERKYGGSTKSGLVIKGEAKSTTSIKPLPNVDGTAKSVMSAKPDRGTSLKPPQNTPSQTQSQRGERRITTTSKREENAEKREELKTPTKTLPLDPNHSLPTPPLSTKTAHTGSSHSSRQVVEEFTTLEVSLKAEWDEETLGTARIRELVWTCLTELELMARRLDEKCVVPVDTEG
ncbi:hypothetical protein M231_02763 [Tremella mesenterica]|uniref:Uncharacterized protein n=1 Tax=Tremella mesenterica TaxID=5217 RepID=A0A4Q1BPY2_TREME|nr:uncharacterized protein TREMEDRAFT_62019 [Tremella mesenterica DSM 1558]EIW70257.1 hypothetical protein TREMEDRAFT_62019 [Tremella mesenterica DSM 1558]RXK39968.1 hypothetical protein M231_02763 [Tremella mesenterica]